MADLQDEPAFGGERGQLTRVGRVFCDRFFDEEMFSAREKIPSDFEMRVRWRRDRSGVHLFCELFQRRHRRNSKLIRVFARSRCICVVDRGELRAGKFRVKPGVIFPDVPHPDDADAKLVHSGFASGGGFFRNHSYVRAMPSRNAIVCRQPSSCTFETSRSLRGVPSGFVVSQASSPLNPTMSQISSANSRIETSSPQPTLMISGLSYFSRRKRQAAARSSTWRNSRRGLPEPQTISSRASLVFASCAFRRSAGKTCDESKSKLSLGP